MCEDDHVTRCDFCTNAPWTGDDLLTLSESEDTLLFEQMPSRLNPAQGWIANWDNKRAPDWDGGDGARWWAVDGTARIMALL